MDGQEKLIQVSDRTGIKRLGRRCIVGVTVPQKAWPLVLEELRVAHPGVSRMKSLARSYIWWPGLDTEIEKMAKWSST